MGQKCTIWPLKVRHMNKFWTKWLIGWQLFLQEEIKCETMSHLSIKSFYLTEICLMYAYYVHVREQWGYFFCGSFMFLFCLVFAMFCARLFICALWSPAGKGLTSWLSFVVSSVSLSLSHWYPGSGVVLDCINSWSLQPYYLHWQDCTHSKARLSINWRNMPYVRPFCAFVKAVKALVRLHAW